jgi:hypothetical protein
MSFDVVHWPDDHLRAIYLRTIAVATFDAGSVERLLSLLASLITLEPVIIPDVVVSKFTLQATE